MTRFTKTSPFPKMSRLNENVFTEDQARLMEIADYPERNVRIKCDDDPNKFKDGSSWDCKWKDYLEELQEIISKDGFKESMTSENWRDFANAFFTSSGSKIIDQQAVPFMHLVKHIVENCEDRIDFSRYFAAILKVNNYRVLKEEEFDALFKDTLRFFIDSDKVSNPDLGEKLLNNINLLIKLAKDQDALFKPCCDLICDFAASCTAKDAEKKWHAIASLHDFSSGLKKGGEHREKMIEAACSIVDSVTEREFEESKSIFLGLLGQNAETSKRLIAKIDVNEKSVTEPSPGWNDFVERNPEQFSRIEPCTPLTYVLSNGPDLFADIFRDHFVKGKVTKESIEELAPIIISKICDAYLFKTRSGSYLPRMYLKREMLPLLEVWQMVSEYCPGVELDVESLITQEASNHDAKASELLEALKSKDTVSNMIVGMWKTIESPDGWTLSDLINPTPIKTAFLSALGSVTRSAGARFRAKPKDSEKQPSGKEAEAKAYEEGAAASEEKWSSSGAADAAPPAYGAADLGAEPGAAAATAAAPPAYSPIGDADGTSPYAASPGTNAAGTTSYEASPGVAAAGGGWVELQDWPTPPKVGTSTIHEAKAAVAEGEEASSEEIRKQLHARLGALRDKPTVEDESAGQIQDAQTSTASLIEPKRDIPDAPVGTGGVIPEAPTSAPESTKGAAAKKSKSKATAL